VLTVWERFSDVLARTGAGLAYAPSTAADPAEIDRVSEAAARDAAEEGAARASAAGLPADPRARPRDGTVAESILEEAAAEDAEAIVMGSRGLTGVRSILLGSVSHAVLNHADRPVVVVPSPTVADRRATQRP
jgi:nucleotide-binding universal stress UspA family protein